MVTDARTTHRNYPKPHTNNQIAEDFARLITAMDMLDLDVDDILTVLADKADSAALGAYQALAGKGQPNGYAGLDGAGKLTSAAMLPILDGSSILMNQYLPERLRLLSPTVADWNDALENGFYRSVSGTPNEPAPEHWSGIVLRHSPSYILQMLFERDGGTAWQRGLINGVWGPWVRVYNTEADLDSRYALATDFAYRKIADVTIANGSSAVAIATGGHRFLQFLIGRAQPLDEGAHLRLEFSEDGGTTWLTPDFGESYYKDITAAAGAETPTAEVVNLLTGNAATGVSSVTNYGGWCGQIRIDNANAPRPLVGAFDGTWRNAGIINHIRGSFFDQGVVARTHYRLLFSSGAFEGGRIVVMGVQ